MVNILAKLAHFFHSSKFWVSLIFPGFSRCFWYRGLGINGTYAKKAAQMKEMARSPKTIGFLYFKLVEISSESQKSALKLTFLVNSLIHSSRFSGFWGKANLFHPPKGEGANPARTFTVGWSFSSIL